MRSRMRASSLIFAGSRPSSVSGCLSSAISPAVRSRLKRSANHEIEETAGHGARDRHACRIVDDEIVGFEPRRHGAARASGQG